MTTKWNLIDQVAAQQLTQLTSAPGMVIHMGTTALPQPLQQMPGATSYFASSYLTNVTEQPMTIGGEIVVVRHDQATAKAYNFAFATSNDGQVYFAGPFKHFDAHHSPTMKPAPVEAMFHHVSFTNQIKK